MDGAAPKRRCVSSVTEQYQAAQSLQALAAGEPEPLPRDVFSRHAQISAGTDLTAAVEICAYRARGCATLDFHARREISSVHARLESV